MVEEPDIIPQEKSDKKRTFMKAAFAILLVVLLISIGVIYYTLIAPPNEDGVREFDSYKEFYFSFDGVDYEEGDEVIIEDRLSGLWYNSSTFSTYLMFSSMDIYREGTYDANHPGNLTSQYQIGDRVRIEATIEAAVVNGIPEYYGVITLMEHQ